MNSPAAEEGSSCSVGGASDRPGVEGLEWDAVVLRALEEGTALGREVLADPDATS